MPSAFMLADTFLHLDFLLNKKLLRPDVARGQSRLDRACEEAVNAKRCIGALRYLWRNSPLGAHDVSVQEMKQCLEASPLQRGCSNPDALPAPGDGDEGGASEEEGGEGVGEGEDERVEQAEHSMSDGQLDESGDESDASSLRAPTLRLDDFKEESDPGEEAQPVAAQPV